MNSYRKKMSVVMPAYNEGEHIYDNLLKTESQIKEFCDSFEIICVNDGSKDNTKEEILRAEAECENVRCITYEENAGKGHAIKTGVLQAAGEYIAFLDADLDLSPIHLKDFLEHIQKQDADVVIGSKMHPESELEYPFFRKVISRGYYFILVVLFHLKIHDTQTGVKLFRSELIKNIIKDVETNGYAYDIEVLAIANELGAKIIERPITLHFTREGGFSRIKIKDIFIIFNETLKIKQKVVKIRKNVESKDGHR